MPYVDSPEAKRSAMNLWGAETAKSILDSLQDWNEIAAAEFETDSVAGIVLDICEYAECEHEVEAEYLSSSDDIVAHLPRKVTNNTNRIDRAVGILMLHENGHKKRYESVEPLDFENGEFRELVFSHFIDEGLAVECESARLTDYSEHSKSHLIFSEEAQANTKLMDALIADLLFYIRPGTINTAERRLERYVNGVPGRLSDRAYKVGNFIAARAVVLNNLSLKQALELPDSYYKDFAEEQL